MCARALRGLLITCLCVGVSAAVAQAPEIACVERKAQVPPDYRTLTELRAALAGPDLSVAQLHTQTLERIAVIDEQCVGLNAVVYLNPDGGRIARALDAFRQRGDGTAPPLFGIPLLLKANIDTGDQMPTHAGALALENRRADADADLVARLRTAGALLVGKANLSEWANFRSEHSVSGWSGVGGQTRNPHVLDRNPCGSSSGSAVAVAAGLVPAAIGTETDGSIVCPAGVNGVVGFKPTHGRISSEGIIPIAASQDIAGPFARTVRDAAEVASVMLLDSEDLTLSLKRQALAGARIGVWRQHFGAGSDPRLEAVLQRALEALQEAGAVLIDPLGYRLSESIQEASFAVMLHEFHEGLDRYFAHKGGNPTTLEQVIAFNRANAHSSMRWFGQDLLLLTQREGLLTQRAYRAALRKGRDRLRRQLQKKYAAARLDAVIAITNAPAWPIDLISGDRFLLSSSSMAAISGRPAISLPAGDVHGLPIGVSLIGKRNGDAALLGLAHALEARLPKPPRPTFRPTVGPLQGRDQPPPG